MQEKKIRIGIEDGQLKGLGRTAKSITDDMIRSTRQYTTSSKEALRDLENQIKAIEKRNSVELEGKKRVIDQEKVLIALQRSQGQVEARSISSASGRRDALREVQTTYSAGQSKVGGMQMDFNKLLDESKKQTNALREQIETIKSTSKTEIRDNRVNVEKTIRKDKLLDKLGVTGDPQLALRRTIQKGLLGELGEEEQIEKQKFRAFGKFGRGAGRAFNTAAQLGTSKNEMYALAGLVGLTPVIGSGLSTVANRFLSAGETAEKSMESWSIANMNMGYGDASRDWKGIKKSGIGKSLGLDPSEILKRRASLVTSMNKNVDDKSFMDLMGAERFVGSGNIDQLAGVGRYGSGEIDKVIRVLGDGFKSTTKLNENISTYIQASNTALNISSKIDEKSMAQAIIGVSKATGQTGRGLNQVTGAIQGLGSTSNPMTKSLMMRAFRQTNPGASMFDIQAMMEDPLANLQNGGGQFLKNIKGMTGGGQMYKQVLYSIFGGQLSRTRINEILEKGDFTDIAREASLAKESNVDLVALGEEKTGIGAKATAGADAFFQESGLKMLSAAEKTAETLKEAFEQGQVMYEVLTGFKEVTVKSIESIEGGVTTLVTAKKAEDEAMKAAGIPEWLRQITSNPNMLRR